MKLIDTLRALFISTLHWNQAIYIECKNFYEILKDSETPEEAFERFDSDLKDAPYDELLKEQILAIIQARYEDAQTEYEDIQSGLN